ncbi:MAG TPA: bacillithiol biosynthesis cysteine-adding enzyme BshC, partial [Gemmatimonadota bacterium]|nr:bacillithiol biosynthesis cysteine-adding enzyme BshC [Gemmatimonadota bacterium]
ETRARLAEIIRGRGVFVATGQQAGLFVSPLLCLYKALTAARLARQLEDRLDIPVMPMFTVASEDHDWGEVDHTYIVDVENQLVRLAVEGPGGEKAPSPPVERIPVGPDVEQALAQLIQGTPISEFKASLLDPLRAAYRPGRSFAHAFQDALGHLLRRHGFLISRTAHPYVKRRTRDLMWREWEGRATIERQLLERTSALQDAGFEPQVGVAEGATNLFYEGSLGRDRIMFDGARGRLRRSGEELSEDQLQRVLEENPERVSPGALLRPVSEAEAFPVVAYVGGPSEIAYLAQSQVLFAFHDVPAPVIVPRAAFRLIEPKVGRVLEKYGLTADDLAGDAAATISGLVKEQTPPALAESIAALRTAADAALQEVERAAVGYDAGSKSAVERGKNAVLSGIRDLESRLQARVKEKNQVMQQQLEKAAVNVYPGGRPQERALNPYPYLVRYGEDLLDAVYESLVTPLD